MKQASDKISIKNLVLPCRIGLFEKERRREQDVIVDVEIFHDLKEAGITDNIDKTVNYSELLQKISKLVSGGESKLLEGLAEKIATLLLEDTGTRKVTVRVKKKKYSRTPNVEVEITRLQHG